MNPENLYAVIPFRRRACGKEHPESREYSPRFDLSPVTHSEACAWMRNCRTEVTETMNPDNLRSAERAADILTAYCHSAGCDPEDALPDLLADLAHWCDANGQSLSAALGRACNHYSEESETPVQEFCAAF